MACRLAGACTVKHWIGIDKDFFMKTAFLILICALMPLSAYAGKDSWAYIVSSNKDDIYMRTASVKVNNDFYKSVNAWVKYENKKDKSYDIAKMQYYCKSDSFEKLEYHNYDKSGNHISSNTKSGDFQYAVPDTVGVDLTEAACVSAALTELIRFHYIDDGDITAEHYKKILEDFGEYSIPAMLYYNEQTGSTN